jgi:hypothetical protein
VSFITGAVTEAKNITANLHKILRPTRFSGITDIKADKVSFGHITRFFFNWSCWHTDFVENKAKTLKANKAYSKYKSLSDFYRKTIKEYHTS